MGKDTKEVKQEVKDESPKHPDINDPKDGNKTYVELNS